MSVSSKLETQGLSGAPGPLPGPQNNVDVDKEKILLFQKKKVYVELNKMGRIYLCSQFT